VVLDPFAGSGTTVVVATGHGRVGVGIDLNPLNADVAKSTIGPLLFSQVDASDIPAQVEACGWDDLPLSGAGPVERGDDASEEGSGQEASEEGSEQGSLYEEGDE
jgi:hypothetical protein